MAIKAKPTCGCFSSKFDGNKNLSESSQPFLLSFRYKQNGRKWEGKKKKKEGESA